MSNTKLKRVVVLYDQNQNSQQITNYYTHTPGACAADRRAAGAPITHKKSQITAHNSHIQIIIQM